MEFGASFERHKHDAPILNEHGVKAEYARNGLCPYHPDIQSKRQENSFCEAEFVRSRQMKMWYIVMVSRAFQDASMLTVQNH